MSVRDAIVIALEALPGDLETWMTSPAHRAALRAHVRAWVHDFAHARGVVLNDADIDGVLDEMIAERHGKS